MIDSEVKKELIKTFKNQIETKTGLKALDIKIEFLNKVDKINTSMLLENLEGKKATSNDKIIGKEKFIFKNLFIKKIKKEIQKEMKVKNLRFYDVISIIIVVDFVTDSINVFSESITKENKLFYYNL